MADPPAGGAVAADVGEGFVVVAVGRAEGHLLDGLVHYEILQRHNQHSCVMYKPLLVVLCNLSMVVNTVCFAGKSTKYSTEVQLSPEQMVRFGGVTCLVLCFTSSLTISYVRAFKCKEKKIMCHPPCFFCKVSVTST